MATCKNLSARGRLRRSAAPSFYFGTPSICPELIKLGSWSLVCWLASTHTMTTCINFSVCWRLGYMQPTLFKFLDFYISETNRGRNRNLVRWYMCKPTPSTSSSAELLVLGVAKNTRNASCLSVVSFNSTTRRVESFIVSYVGYRFVTACSQMRCSVVFLS